MAEMDRVVGAMQQQLTHIEKTLDRLSDQCGDLRDLLRDQANKPPKRALDLNKLTPKIISVGIIGAAAALQLLPTQVAIKIISSLL